MRVWLLPAMACGLVCTFAVATNAQTPPNVLLLIADDLSPEWLGSYGGGPLTPNLDALAVAGVRFDRAYADPVCTASRVCLLTGRHASRCGMASSLPFGHPGMRDEEFLLPEALAATSYATALFGKWHLGERHGAATPTVQGFGSFTGTLGGSVSSYFNWPKVQNGQTSACTNYLTTDTVDDALAFVRAQTQPWFAVVALHAPHSPFHAPPAALHTQSLVDTPATDPVPFARAMTEALDIEIGRLLLGIATVRANTNVLFVADNGSPGALVSPPRRSSHAKGSLYEGGVRVPLIIQGPAVVRPGRISTALVSAVDLYPTILELCGLQPSAVQPANLPLDGVSLSAVLQDQPVTPRSAVFVEVDGVGMTDGAAMIHADYKLLRTTGSFTSLPHEELYDLSQDAEETRDLLLAALSPAAAAAYAQLGSELLAVQQEGYAVNYGTGCSGSFGTPMLVGFSPPRLGRALPLLTAGTRFGNIEFTVLGWSRQWQGQSPLPLSLLPFGMPGCDLLVSTDAVVHAGFSGGLWYLRLPTDPAFLFTSVQLQVFALERGANAAGVLTSNALQLVIGP